MRLRLAFSHLIPTRSNTEITFWQISFTSSKNLEILIETMDYISSTKRFDETLAADLEQYIFSHNG